MHCSHVLRACNACVCVKEIYMYNSGMNICDFLCKTIVFVNFVNLPSTTAHENMVLRFQDCLSHQEEKIVCQVYWYQFKISTTFSYSVLVVEKWLLVGAIPSRAGKSRCICLTVQNSLSTWNSPS